MSTHRCPGPDCTKQVRRAKLACARHWAQVSPPTARAVYAAYNADPGGPAHVAAMEDAIAEMAA